MMFSLDGLRSFLPFNDSAPPAAGSIEAILKAEKVLLDRVKSNLQSVHVRVGNYWIYTLVVTAPGSAPGDKPPILLLHGHSSGAAMWFTIFDKLVEHYTVYAIDMLGWGRSSRPAFTGETGEDAVTWWLDSIDAWRKSLNLGKITVVGHSLGGLIATRYAVKYPEVVIRLILIACGGILHTTGPYSWYWALFFYYSFPQTFARSMRDLGLRLFREFAMRKFRDSWELNEYQFQLAAQSGPSGEYAITKMMTFCNGGTSAYFNVPLIAHLHKLTMPVTLVWGAEDPLIPLKFAMVALRRTRSARLYVVRRADHGVVSTHPDEVMHAIVDHVPPGVERYLPDPAPSEGPGGAASFCCEGAACGCAHGGGAPCGEAEAEAEDDREVRDALAAVGADAAEAEAEAERADAEDRKRRASVRASLGEEAGEGEEDGGRPGPDRDREAATPSEEEGGEGEGEGAGGLSALQAAAASALAGVRAFLAERAAAGILSRSSSSATVDSLAHSTASSSGPSGHPMRPPHVHPHPEEPAGYEAGAAAAGVAGTPRDAVKGKACECLHPSHLTVGPAWASPPWPTVALQREDALIERHLRCNEHSLEAEHAHSAHRVVFL